MTTPTIAESVPAGPATRAGLWLWGLRVAFDTPTGRVVAVDGIDLHVAPGEVLALVGESGSGKSVSMLAAMGLLPATAITTGSVELNGTELVGQPAKVLRGVRGGDLAMVFQDPMSSLNPVHTIGRQISEVLALHTDLGRRARRRRTVELLGRVGIPSPERRAEDYPHEFSGGMRQRAMIAMALAGEPSVLIADEPTTALDVTVQRQIVELVRELQDERGMGVIWITHDLGVVAELADRVAVMYAGRIAERGSATDVYNRTAHPYTAGLLRSIPRLRTPVTERLPEIVGSPPGAGRPRDRCAFIPRCPHAGPGCEVHAPELAPVAQPTDAGASDVQHDDPRHLAACIHTDLTEPPAIEPTVAVPEGRTERVVTSPTPGAQPLIEIDDLVVHFPVRRGTLGVRRAAVRAVDGVTLELSPGRTLGVVGESGCGKSTLGRTLVGLIAPTSGQVRVDGRPVSTDPGRERRRVQMIFQDPFSSMNPGMRVRDVIAEPIHVHELHEEHEVPGVVEELLVQVGLPADCGDRHPHEFSGGQRQRIAVARALAAQPQAIVCDEAVSSLDVSVQAQIVNLLRDLQRDQNLAYVFIAHDLAVVRHVADEVAVMYLGQVVERAPRDELYATPLHPYTRGLIDAVPEPVPGATDDHGTVLRGDLPSPIDPPPGCRFHTRCPIAVPGTCDVEVPALRTVAPGRTVACHFVDVDDGTPVPAIPAEGLGAAPPSAPAGHQTPVTDHGDHDPDSRTRTENP